LRVNALKKPSTASTAREQRYGLMPTIGVPHRAREDRF
jgi:hypothetical protein